MGDEWRGASYKQIEDHSSAAATLLERINATTIPALLRGTSVELDTYVDELLVLEKSARLGGDVLSTQRLAVEAIRIYRSEGKFERMLELLDSLMKRRAQTKQVQSAMVLEASLALADLEKKVSDNEEEQASGSSATSTLAERTQLLTRLANVTEGKIHVELEHARFVAQLAEIVAAEGRTREAADMLQNLQIETITNMPRLEKLTCINRQISLCLTLDDHLRVPLISRKVNYRALNRPDTVAVKLRHMELMREHYASRKLHLLLARCYYETFLTTTDDDEKLKALSNMAVCIFIAEPLTKKEIDDGAEYTAFSPDTKLESRDAALTILLSIKRLEHELAPLHKIAVAFTSADLIRVSIQADMQLLCEQHPLLGNDEERAEHFRSRASEHDLLVVAQYYRRIRLERLSELVRLPAKQVERFIMSLVANKTIYAKIDRVDGVVVFQKPKNCADVVKEWNESVQTCVSLIDRAAHLVVKERMIHALPLSTAATASS